jgi:hypothetical protein
MSFAEELRTRLKAKQKDWEKCREDMRKVKEKDAALREEIAAIQVLLNTEEPQLAASTSKPAPVAIDSGDRNKAESVRQLIEEVAGSEGLSPAQIRKLLEARGVTMPTNYLYAILGRSKKAGQVVEKSGRYFPTEKAKAAS